MKVFHVCLIASLAIAVSSFAAFTHAGLEIRGIDVYSSAPQEKTQPEPVKGCTEETPSNVATSVYRPKPLGPTYKISEPDILELFMNRLNTMKADASYQKRFEEQKKILSDRFQNPLPVENLSKSTNKRLWLLEPSIPETLPESLLRQASQVELPKLSGVLIFIDGTDDREIEAARVITHSFSNTRVVLTAGSIPEISRKLKRRIFFDQGGGLTRVFGVSATPAVLFNGHNGPSGMEFPPDEVSEHLSEIL